MNIHPRIALATLTETRADFRSRRAYLVEEEIKAISWLKQRIDVLESDIIVSVDEVQSFAKQVENFGAQALLVHIPVWTAPVLTVKLAKLIPLPILLIGNLRSETSSMVGILGAGGSLDQCGIAHERIFDHRQAEAQEKTLAFTRAAAALKTLKGQTFGMFGGRSLGMITATADPAQWQKMFGVDIDHIDQAVIIDQAEAIPAEDVERYTQWLYERLGKIEFGENFNQKALGRQIRSYLATRALVEQQGYDFIGVKCQPELSDGYVTQCLVHTLMNGLIDADGDKKALVHTCEADADGALTMQILHLLSAGQPAALLDMRWFDADNGVWTLANCGAIPATFAATKNDPSGLSNVHLIPHVFGRGGGGALPLVVSPQEVTLARLCRRDGEYWMAIVRGETKERDRSELEKATPAFPQAFIRSSAGMDLLEVFGSNHFHMVSGDFTKELVAFCRLVGISWRLWD